MDRHDRGNGIVVEVETGAWSPGPPAPSPRPAATRGPVRGLPRGPVSLTPPSAGGGDELTDSLERQGFSLADVVDFQAGTGAPSLRSAAGAEPVLRVQSAPDEHAVVLLSKEGVYEWVLPEPSAAGPSRGLRSGPSAAPRELVFRLPTASSGPRSRGFASAIVGGGFRAYVLRFVARVLTPLAIGFLERDVVTGLVGMTDPDPRGWSSIEGTPRPPGSSPRVLLFVHGTFSSTIGSYHALAATDMGRAFLKWASTHYDEVIGYDHATLSVDPRTNAEDLHQRLQRRWGDAQPVIDVVAFSRGGLVARTLVEQILPGAPWRPRVDRVVMVGCTNGGTHLAEPENWKSFVDFYTSLATHTVKLVSSALGAAVVGKVLDEAIKSVGALVKHLAVHAAAEGGVPGLAAMRPDGPFVRELNLTNPGQPEADGVHYYVVRSEFEPGKVVIDGVGSIGRALRDFIIDRLADDLLGTENDLVVDTSSMDRIDPHVGTFVKERLDFGANGWVHHLAYFTRGETATAIHRWLRADGPGAHLPGSLEVRVWEVDASAPIGTLTTLRRRDPDRAVVVRRRELGPDGTYAFTSDEITERLATTGADPDGVASVRDALDLHEHQVVPPVETSALPATAPAPDRVVPVTEHGRIVGVVVPTDLRGAPKMARPPAAANGGSHRGPTRSGEPKAAAPESTASARLECRAEMPEMLTRGSDFELLVLLSREALTAAAPGIAAASQSTEGDPNAQLRISVSPRTNLAFDEPSFADVPFPQPGEPVDAVFTGQALEVGPAEAWVFVRQGQRRLARLSVAARIVAPGEAAATGRSRSRADIDRLAALADPPFTLRVIEVRVGSALELRYELEALGHDLRLSYASKPIEDLPAFVARMYAEIEQKWRDSAGEVKTFQRLLRSYGAELFQSLLPRELQAALWAHRETIESILVLSTETYVPWELLHLCDPTAGTLPNETIFLAQKGLVRWLHNVPAEPAKVKVRAGKIRHIVPDYPAQDWKLPATKAELDYLVQRFGSTTVGTSAEDLYALLEQQDAFDLLHFAGHGEAVSDEIEQAGILMEGRVADGQWLPDRARALVVRQLPRAPASTARPLVFLNACQVGRQGRTLGSLGGFASAFLSRGAGAFIGPLWSVGDHPAFTFGQALYDALLAGDTLAAAATKARNLAAQAADSTWLAYAVYGHHDARLELDPGLAPNGGDT